MLTINTRIPNWSLLAVSALAFIVTSCRQNDAVTPTAPEDVLIINTPDSGVAQTLQAEVALTAAYIATLNPLATPTSSVLPTFDMAQAQGTPISQLIGLCPLIDGYMLHIREGFCISAPENWVILNVDGGLAASLSTTPDRAIFIQPDWATSNQMCNLFIYIASESSAAAHLQTRHTELSTSQVQAQITDVSVRQLGDLKFPGFFWTMPDGSTGAAFSDMIGLNELLHISFSGTQCTAADLTPVINTLRIQPTQR